MSQSVKIVYFSSLITGPWEWGHIPIPSPKIMLFMLIPLSEDPGSLARRQGDVSWAESGSWYQLQEQRGPEQGFQLLSQGHR